MGDLNARLSAAGLRRVAAVTISRACRRQGRPGFWATFHPRWGPLHWQGVRLPLCSLHTSICSLPSSWGGELVLVAHKNPFLTGYSQLYLLCDGHWQNGHMCPVLHSEAHMPPSLCSPAITPLVKALLSTAVCTASEPCALRPLCLPAPFPTLLQVCLPAVQQPCSQCPFLLSTRPVHSLCSFSLVALWGCSLYTTAHHSNLLGSAHTQSCAFITTVSFRTFSLPKKMSQPVAITPWALATTLCSVSQDLPCSGRFVYLELHAVWPPVTGFVGGAYIPQVLHCGIPFHDWLLLCCVGRPPSAPPLTAGAVSTCWL